MLDEHVENEISDLQQRLDFSKPEQLDDGWWRGCGFNKRKPVVLALS